jgi:hypothetical protein
MSSPSGRSSPSAENAKHLCLVPAELLVACYFARAPSGSAARRIGLPPDLGERHAGAITPNVLGRSFEAPAPNRKWTADFT